MSPDLTSGERDILRQLEPGKWATIVARSIRCSLQSRGAIESEPVPGQRGLKSRLTEAGEALKVSPRAPAQE